MEYPGIWQPDAVEDSLLTPLIKQQLATLCDTEPFHRQLFIRQSHQRSDRTRCFVVRSSETDPYIVRADVATCDGPIVTVDPEDAKRVTEPMFLVCTHGNHDKCCAKWGLPVYHAARSIAHGQAWQCSHVGGDRFAGNLLCFPHGIYYGHVMPADVPRLTESYKRGEIDLKHYRGRCCYAKAAQVAEYFARSESGLLLIDDLKLESATRGEEWLVRFQGERKVYEVGLRSRAGATEMLTCKAERPNPIPRYEMASYRVFDRN
jgi:hypothetical protein